MFSFIRTLLSRLAFTGLSSWHSSFSSSISSSFSSLRTCSRSKLVQGSPPRAMEVRHSDLAPTAVALTFLAAHTRPPMMVPRPDRTSTSPSQ